MLPYASESSTTAWDKGSNISSHEKFYQNHTFRNKPETTKITICATNFR